MLVSFDVASLFTNLPLHDILASIDSKKCLWIAILIFQLSWQWESLLLVSKISPILCIFVLNGLVKDWLNRTRYNIPFLKQYVGDLILSVDKIETTLEMYNTYNSQGRKWIKILASLSWTCKYIDIWKTLPKLNGVRNQ